MVSHPQEGVPAVLLSSCQVSKMDVVRPFEAETLEAVKHHFCCILLVNGECYLKFNRRWDERWEDTKLVYGYA